MTQKWKMSDKVDVQRIIWMTPFTISTKLTNYIQEFYLVLHIIDFEKFKICGLATLSLVFNEKRQRIFNNKLEARLSIKIIKLLYHY